MIMIKKVYFIIFVYNVLKFPLKSHCMENNVCERIRDYYTININNNCEYDVAADLNSDPTTIIMFYGYTAETHKVTTSDGYILTMFRIITNEVTSIKSPVFLQHGLMSSAINFLGLRKNSLAFVLADAGYDVWLGNYRGTQYSEEHVNLTVFDKQYWNYSFDEIGLYDIPAQLNYVSQATGSRGNIVFIGHSLGGTVGLVYTSSFPEQARKIVKLLILLAPAVPASNSRAPSLINTFRIFTKSILKIITDNNSIRLVSQAEILKPLVQNICLRTPLLMQRCVDTFNLFAGRRNQIAPKTLPVIYSQIPGGSSFKVSVQLADFSTNNFRRYDYGSGNFEKYGSSEPPSYNLKKIQVPTFLVYAINDMITIAEDCLAAYNNLPPIAKYGKYEITVPNFNHADFIYGSNAKSILYDVILQVLTRVE